MSLTNLGVFGGLDLHGIPRSVAWTRLAQTASAGANQIVVETGVDWVVGDEIVIASTTISAWQTEIFKISAVSSNTTLTLDGTLQYAHLGRKQYT